MHPRLRLLGGGLLACCLALSMTAAKSAPDVQAPAGFTPLFNGKDLAGWQGHVTMKERTTLSQEKLAELQKKRNDEMPKFWSVEDGLIRCAGGKKGVSLQTTKDYGNFEMLVDWKIEKHGDSGIYLRGQPQVQIWDSENIDPKRLPDDVNTGSGGLWNNPKGSKEKIPLKKADKPVGEWNTFHITVVGDEVTVKLNGELVVDKGKLLNYWDRGKPVPATGPIELQFHGDPLWFKNVYVKELP
jgi:hypothetical protein